MSYTKSIKNELAILMPSCRCCLIAEIAGFINTAGTLNESGFLVIRTENWNVARKYFTLIKKTFNIDIESTYIKKKTNDKTSLYELIISDKNSIKSVLNATGIGNDNALKESMSLMVIKKDCCKRAFTRGSFLISGSLSSPERSYHLEIAFKDESSAKTLINVLSSFKINAKMIQRPSNYALYIKDSNMIADFINVSGAVNVYLEFENSKVVKEVRNTINRKVNCESANIKRSVLAAQKQINYINVIDKNIGLSSLHKNLIEVAKIRLENPDMSLLEIAEMLKISKSGVNHRFRKIEQIANEIIENKEKNIEKEF